MNTHFEQCAVIFDIDGVLVDSYDAHFQSWRATLSQHGFDMTQQQFATTFGRTSREIIKLYWGEKELSESTIREIDKTKEAQFRDIVSADFPVMAGAIKLIGQLHDDGFRLAVGSSGPPENVQLALDKLDIGDVITAAVSGADVARGKPDPQVFLTAAERIDVPPVRCAVIEDAAPGIAAANAAGMISIALVSTGHSRDEFSDADYIVQTLNELSAEQFRSWLD